MAFPDDDSGFEREMPTGDMSSGMMNGDPLSEGEMPTGMSGDIQESGMHDAGDGTLSVMPDGRMTFESSSDAFGGGMPGGSGFPISDESGSSIYSDFGDVTDADEMPGGEMNDPVGLALYSEVEEEMPIGEMISAESGSIESGAASSGAAVDLSGTWRLSLSFDNRQG